MNTIWLKIAGGTIVVLVIIIAVASFTGGGSSSSSPEPATSPEPKTFHDTVEQDRQNHPVVPPAPIEEETVAATATTTPAAPPVNTVPVTAPQSEPQPQPETPKVVYVKPLSETDEMQAQQLLSWAGTNLSIGKLPIMQYGQAVRSCKEVIQRWPESWYAYQAKRILIEIANFSSSYRKQYRLTDDLLDVSQFYQKRPGTQPLPIPNDN